MYQLPLVSSTPEVSSAHVWIINFQRLLSRDQNTGEISCFQRQYVTIVVFRSPQR